MKKYTVIALVVAFALLGGISIRSQGLAERQTQKHQVVIFGYQAEFGDPIITEWGGYRPQIGLITYWSRSSAGAPVVTNGSEVVTVVAELLDHGFRVQPQLSYGEYTFIRP